jgi:ABC-type Fe3+/spermidine/putrescine transport system ATPase subunit
MTSIRLEGLTKYLGDTRSVDDVSLEIEAGELFLLLGPSGCGKTTLLNLIAGLLQPTRGRILFGDRDVTHVGTDKRKAVLCFQGYALWPHLSVHENVRFGLDVRNESALEKERAVRSALELVRMQGYASRMPSELSGGQQQRVAIARAVAAHPDCLLLDEPLSNLDADLRHHMRGELRRICREAGLTTVYVTHDQKEALSIADRLAVMKEGRVIQIGTPEELYHRPNSLFVAEFLGQTNAIPGRVVERVAASDGQRAAVVVETLFGKLRVEGSLPPPSALRVTVTIRPDQLRLSSEAQSSRDSSLPNRFPARVLESSFLGTSSEHRIRIVETELRMLSFPARAALPGEVSVVLEPEQLLAFPADSGT